MTSYISSFSGVARLAAAAAIEKTRFGPLPRGSHCVLPLFLSAIDNFHGCARAAIWPLVQGYCRIDGVVKYSIFGENEEERKDCLDFRMEKGERRGLVLPGCNLFGTIYAGSHWFIRVHD